MKEFRTILLVQNLRIYTYHKNLTCKNFNTDRIIRWIIQVKGYGTDIECIKGDKKIVTDALSIFPLDRNQKTTHQSTYKKVNSVRNQ